MPVASDHAFVLANSVSERNVKLGEVDKMSVFLLKQCMQKKQHVALGQGGD